MPDATKSRGWLFLLMAVLCLSAWAQTASFEAARTQRKQLLSAVRKEVNLYPALQARRKGLEKQLEGLAKSTGREPPEVSMQPDAPPKFPTLTPVKMDSFTPEQRKELQQLDAQIKQQESHVPAVERCRSQIRRLEIQISGLKRGN